MLNIYPEEKDSHLAGVAVSITLRQEGDMAIRRIFKRIYGDGATNREREMKISWQRQLNSKENYYVM